MTLGFSTGFSVTIPNDVLVVPDSSVGSDGAVQTNSSASIVRIGVLIDANANDNPTIGRDFFASAYLMVDLEANTFTLWTANATSDTNLVTLDRACPTNASNITDNTDDGNAATIPGTASETATASPETNGSIPTTTIVGAVVGGVLGAGALIATAIFCVWRRRNWAKSSQSMTELTAHEHTYPDNNSSGPPSYVWRTNESGSYEVVEMSATELRPHELNELQAPRTPKYELDAS